MDKYVIQKDVIRDKYSSSSSISSSERISMTKDGPLSSVTRMYIINCLVKILIVIVDHYFLFKKIVLDLTGNYLSSPSRSPSTVTSNNVLSASNSPLVIGNSPSLSSSSSSSSTYTIEKLRFLLRNDEERWNVVSNTAKSAKAVHWLNFGFPAKLNEQSGIFEKINGFASCRHCEKTYV